MKKWKSVLVFCMFSLFLAAPASADIWDDDVPAKTSEPVKKVESPKPAPKAETPKPAPAPAPKAEEPKKVEPKAEAPKPAPAPAPKAEEPKKVEPKAEAPKPAPSPKKEPPKQEKKDSINVKAPIVLDTAKTTNVEQPKPVTQSKSGLDPMYKALIISASFIVVGGVTALVFDMMAKDATSGTPKNPAEYKDGLDDAGQYQSVRDIGLGVLFTGVVGAGLSFCF